MTDDQFRQILTMTHRRKGWRFWDYDNDAWNSVDALRGRRVACSRKGDTVWDPPAVGTVTRVISGSLGVVWDGTSFEDEMEPDDLSLLPAEVCPVHGLPWIPGEFNGRRSCEFFIPELGASENYGCDE